METSLTWLGRITTAPSAPDWQRLSEVYAPLLAGWLGRIGVPPHDRDDLVQEVLLVVVRRVNEFEHRGPGAFRAWVRGILANHARKYFRTRPHRPTIDPDQLASDESELAARWDREHDEHLAVRALQVVQADFSPTTWEAFRRQVFDQDNPAVVAVELGLSLNAVLMAKRRVLKRLREELAGVVE